MLKIIKFPYKIEPYDQEHIDEFKSKDNMLSHARCNKDTIGYFYVSKKTGNLMGYVGIERDTIVALEVPEKFQGRGYATRLLSFAVRSGADKLSVDKNNSHAIDVY